MLAADIFYGISGCLIKVFSRDENPVTLSGYQFAIGGAVLRLTGGAQAGMLVVAGILLALGACAVGIIKMEK